MEPRTPPQRNRSTTWIYSVVLVVIALVVRWVYLYESRDCPSFREPLIDAQTYHDLARRMAEGGGIGEGLFWQSPFYPLFLAAVYKIFGVSIVAAKLIQTVLGAITCLITFHFGRLLFDRRTGLLAGVIVALYGPMIFFDGQLLATAWASLWAISLVFLFWRAGRDGSAAWLLAAGICGGLAVMTRSVFLPFVLAMFLWLLVVQTRRLLSWPRRLAALATFLAGLAIVGVPAGQLSEQVTRRWSLIPASAGINLYLGNNPRGNESLTIRPGWEWQALTRSPALHGITRKEDTSAFFAGQVREYARTNPAAFLRGLVDKSAQWISSRELPRNIDLYLHRKWSWTLSLLLWKVGWFGFPFGLVFPLAVVGVIGQRRRIPATVWIFLALYSASIVMVFCSSRYRTPAIPLLAILAAAGFFLLAEQAGRRRWKELSRNALIMAAAVALSGPPGPFAQELVDHEADFFALLGARAAEEGEFDRAASLVEQALEKNPNHSDAENTMGNLLRKRGEIAGAIEHYEKAVEISPQNTTARGNLAWLLLKRDPERSAEEFEKAIPLQPFNTRLHHGYGIALTMLGRRDEAIEEFVEALKCNPKNLPVYEHLGRTFHALREFPRAAEVFETGLKIDPANLPLLDSLALTLRRLGRPEEALERYRAGLAAARARGDAETAAQIERRLAPARRARRYLRPRA